MVFFSCDGCGEMLKKNQVDAHAYKCRRCYAVSCVDCSRSFPGGTYLKKQTGDKKTKKKKGSKKQHGKG